MRSLCLHAQWKVSTWQVLKDFILFRDPYHVSLHLTRSHAPVPSCAFVRDLSRVQGSPNFSLQNMDFISLSDGVGGGHALPKIMTSCMVMGHRNQPICQGNVLDLSPCACKCQRLTEMVPTLASTRQTSARFSVISLGDSTISSVTSSMSL